MWSSAWIPSYFQCYSWVELYCTMYKPWDLGMFSALRFRQKLQLRPRLHFVVWIGCKPSFPESDFFYKDSQCVPVSFADSPIKTIQEIEFMGLTCFLAQPWPPWNVKERSGQKKSTWLILQPFSWDGLASDPLKPYGRVMFCGKITWKGDHVFWVLATP